MKAGRVYIAGAGPGDEKLISVGALELIKEAEVIVYDRLGVKRFLDYANENCEMIDAGKQPSHHRLNQSQINTLLIEKAKEGKKVLRLKGGDPFLFGRGGEECEALEKAGIAFEVIPGISSFYSVCAYAGIPVTHRDVASSFHVFTGHRVEKEKLNYANIAKMEGTLIFLMSMKRLDEISKKLIEEGKAKDTPVSAIQWGTTSKQRSITASLSEIAQKAKEAGIGHPSVVIMGDVVTQKMDWQKYRPLFGKHILLAGSGESALEAKKILQQQGAEVTVFSAIEIVEKQENMIQAINDLKEYTWIFFTSVYSVEFFFESMKKQKKDIRQLQGIHIFCIGEKTKEAVEKRGIFVDRMPKEYNSKSGAEEMECFLTKEDKILFPASELASCILEKKAKQLGVKMIRITAYENHQRQKGKIALQKAFEKGIFDGVGFFSSSLVKNMFLIAGESIKNCQLFAIGDATEQAIIQKGGIVKAKANVSTAKGLAEVICESYDNHL